MPTEPSPGSPTELPGQAVQLLLGQLRDGTAAPDVGHLLDEVVPTLLALSGAASVLVARRGAEEVAVVAQAGQPLEWCEEATALLSDPASGIPEPWQTQGVGHLVVRPLPGGAGVLALAWPTAGEVSNPAATELALGLLDASVARIRAEEDLRDLTTRVDNAQQLALMGDYDWHITTDTNRWSDQLYRIYGHEPQSFNASYERFLSHIHPDDRDRIMAIHQHAYATGEPYQMIERVVRPDGEVRYLSSNGQVIMDEAGNPVRMRGTCVDITERVLAEEDRTRIASRFRSLVESSPDAIVVADRVGEILQSNGRAAELLGGEPVGHRIDEILTTEEPGELAGLEASGFDGRPLRLDVARARLSDAAEDGETAEDGLVAIFLHDATTRLANEAFTAHLKEAQLRRHQALEINDNVVQGLTSALYALEMGDTGRTVSFLRRTLAAAGRMIDDLVMPLSGEDLHPRDLVRATASSLDPDEPEPQVDLFPG
jgi:PAS domain S-box-containing protein